MPFGNFRVFSKKSEKNRKYFGLAKKKGRRGPGKGGAGLAGEGGLT
jgi:hypothetical protein